MNIPAVRDYLLGLQERIIGALQAEDGKPFLADGWTRDPGILELMNGYFRDALREVQALRVEGFREGDPVDGIPTLTPITTKVAKLGGAA